MRVVVSGNFKDQILLDTTKATGLLIEIEGEPVVIYKVLEGGKGYIRLTKGEDQNFDDIARQLKLTKI